MTVSQTVVSVATLDVLGSVGVGSPNRLLFSLIDSLADTTGVSQLLADPSFDYGTTFWIMDEDVCTVVNPTGCPPLIMSFPSHSGKNHATLGGKPQTFHLSSETVTIPSTVRKAELSFYLWVVTRGNKHTADDVLSVEIRSPPGALLGHLG